MGTVVEITLENFEQVVIQGSMERAVVVDFWAPWCGPCRALGPMLEQLSQELDFTLAKVDTESQPDIAAYFQISSIPDVRIFQGGQQVDGFQGALPEPQLRKVLSRFFLSPLDAGLMEAETLLDAGRNQEALQALKPLLQTDSSSRKVQFFQAKALVGLGRAEEAKPILHAFQDGDDFVDRARALLNLMEFHVEAARTDVSAAPDIAYRDACRKAVDGDYEGALDAFLAVVTEYRDFRDGAARKAMVTLFNALGPKHELTWAYRSRLNSILFS